VAWGSLNGDGSFHSARTRIHLPSVVKRAIVSPVTAAAPDQAKALSAGPTHGGCYDKVAVTVALAFALAAG